ncbi:hypothetical protein [Edaphobacter modestus]|uniref:Uncharacterized protein n=1 Tax=Edaphobacter modestus TaxID=388466 RepID=A0A4Q7YPB6_9BACT|nr:hypothetical protein [Edaphobacter modestus]RZU38894.1 hypothetical protein BDD14_0198 [Edaphobacter modestus]
MRRSAKLNVDKTAKYIVEMEHKWAEGICVDNGVVAGLLADDFQGTSTKGARFTKADELRTRKAHTPLIIADLMRLKCVSSETVLPLSTAANMLSAKTSPAKVARFGLTRG